MVEKEITIVWKKGERRGQVALAHGTLLRVSAGTVTDPEHGSFHLSLSECRLTVAVRYASFQARPYLRVAVDKDPFTFFIHDVRAPHPIYLPSHEVAVTEGSDPRSYEEIADAIDRRGMVRTRMRLRNEDEASYRESCRRTRVLPGPMWFGLSRDVRVFTFNFRAQDVDRPSERVWDWIQPRLHAEELVLPEAPDRPIRYHFFLGRGVGPAPAVERHLDDGTLPILHGRVVDEDVVYDTICFASMERNPLTIESVQGTDFLVADGYGHGHMMTADQAQRRERILQSEGLNSSNEPTLYFEATAMNIGNTPRHAWFKSVIPDGIAHRFEPDTGFSMFSSDRVFAISQLNGEPLMREETGFLLEPGEVATFRFFLPHNPISRNRAERLACQEFQNHYRVCRSFWSAKLKRAAQVDIPEPTLSERVKAGLLHLDLVCYGREPDGPLVPMVGGNYTAIGSESAPMIQFMDSMGWTYEAQRALEYFLEKQHPDGFMQNYGGYMLETGAILWSLGEHYRYTRDNAWIAHIAPHVIAACEYLIAWRERNMNDLSELGHGLLDGKCADPEDPFRSFMLNGYAYLGLMRSAEMLCVHDSSRAATYEQAALALKESILTALNRSFARGPVVPLGDGTWCPTVAPWPGPSGPVALYADGGLWHSHGTVTVRDSLLGPLWLIFQEVIDPGDPLAEIILDYHGELMCSGNVAFSQPYYSMHPWVHLKRGEIPLFLKAYYDMVASLSDREIYGFWEHYFHASPHKTHEEAWFLMQTRWMLYLENGDDLTVLPGVPRDWLRHGATIGFTNARSYFGPLSLKVESRIDQDEVIVEIECTSSHRPKNVHIRIPHPEGRRAAHVNQGAHYDAQTESIILDGFNGHTRITVSFDR